MGREIRKVPKGWNHPKDTRGRYRPMFIESYELALEKWLENHRLWEIGKHPAQMEYPEETKDCRFYAEWSGNPPSVEYYNPNKWSLKEANCYQVYENVTEGTPLSPVFESLKEVESWLVDSLDYDWSSAKEFCRTYYAPTFTGTMPASWINAPKEAEKGKEIKKVVPVVRNNKRSRGL